MCPVRWARLPGRFRQVNYFIREWKSIRLVALRGPADLISGVILLTSHMYISVILGKPYGMVEGVGKMWEVLLSQTRTTARRPSVKGGATCSPFFQTGHRRAIASCTKVCVRTLTTSAASTLASTQTPFFPLAITHLDDHYIPIFDQTPNSLHPGDQRRRGRDW